MYRVVVRVIFTVKLLKPLLDLWLAGQLGAANQRVKRHKRVDRVKVKQARTRLLDDVAFVIVLVNKNYSCVNAEFIDELPFNLAPFGANH